MAKYIFLAGTLVFVVALISFKAGRWYEWQQLIRRGQEFSEMYSEVKKNG